MPRTDLRLATFAVLGLVLTACTSTKDDKSDSIDWLVTHGRYEEAVRKSAAAAEKNPNDEKAQAEYRDASLAWLLERGRRLTFEDQDVEALALFDQASELAPDRSAPRTWIGKTRHKLAAHWLETGLELHASDKLEGAIDAYENALKFDPGNRSALTGLAEATLAVNYRTGLGKGYYEQGLHALAEAWLERARGDFAKTGKYKDYLADQKHFETRKGQVDLELSEQRATVAASLEQDGKFDAARNEFRLALSLNPNNEVAKVGKERSEIEAHAGELYRGARMELVRGRLEHALELVEEGAKLTTVQKERFEGLVNEIQEARYERIYTAALALSRDGKYSEAVEKYGELLKIAAYYKDAITRKETLEDFIQRAEKLYTQAATEGDTTKKLAFLRQILQFWPDYKDVAVQLRDLTKDQPPQ